MSWREGRAERDGKVEAKFLAAFPPFPLIIVLFAFRHLGVFLYAVLFVACCRPPFEYSCAIISLACIATICQSNSPLRTLVFGETKLMYLVVPVECGGDGNTVSTVVPMVEGDATHF